MPPENVEAASALVERLDGLPLPIELAAGRLGVLSVSAVAERLSLSLLRAGTDDRHGTLAAALDWSWDLLTAPQQTALARLSVFVDGATLAAAEAVVGSDSFMRDLAGLVDASLVAVREGRLELLQSVAEFARARLADPGPVEARHGRVFAVRGTPEAIVGLDRTGGVARVAALARELGNLVVAVRRAVDRGDPDVAVPALCATCAVVELRGPYGLAVELASAVRGLPDLTPTQQAYGLRVAGLAAWRSGDDVLGVDLMEQALRIFGALGDDPAAARVRGSLAAALSTAVGPRRGVRYLFDAAIEAHVAAGDRATEGIIRANLGTLLAREGEREEAREQLQRALTLARTAGNERNEAFALGNLGETYRMDGDLDLASDPIARSVALFREVGDQSAAAALLLKQGGVESNRGNLDAAETCFRDALDNARRVGRRALEGQILVSLGLHVHRRRLDLDAAEAAFEEARQIYEAAGDRVRIAAALGNLGLVASDRGDVDRAVALYGAVLAAQDEVGNRRGQSVTLGNLGRLSQRGGDLRGARRYLEAAIARAREYADYRVEGLRPLRGPHRLPASRSDLAHPGDRRVRLLHAQPRGGRQGRADRREDGSEGFSEGDWVSGVAGKRRRSCQSVASRDTS